MKEDIIILLDFDRTLFDTDRFIFEIKRIFNKHKINNQKFLSTYKKIKPYNITKQLSLLEADPKTKNNILTEINTLIKNTNVFLYTDALEFLKFLKKNRVVNILVTYGDKNFQKNKVKNSGIGPFFNKQYYISSSQNKIEVYKKIIKDNKNKKVIIVDDLRENTNKDAQKIPNTKIIKIVRSSKSIKVYNFKNYYKVKNLKQIIKLFPQL